MKKVVTLQILLCLGLIGLVTPTFGQLSESNDQQNVEDYWQSRTVTPYYPNSRSATGTCDLNLQYLYNVADTTSSTSIVGAIHIGNEFWISRWNTPDLWRLTTNGQLIENFTISGLTNVRSLTWDGTHIWAGNATTTIYQIDPATKSIVSTVSVPENARQLTYDPDADNGNGGFWLGNWSTDIYQVDMSGNILTQIPAATHGQTGMYGSAYDNVSMGGPYLWVFDNDATPSEAAMVQLQLPSGTPTGFVKDVGAELGSGLAGGLFIANTVVPNQVTLGGIRQTGLLFGYELNFTPSTCQRPDGLDTANVTGTSADLSWTAGTGSTWNVEWGEAGFSPGSGTLVSGLTTTNYNLTGLVPGRVYQYWVQDDCSGGDVSCWTGPFTFQTICPPTISAPFTEDFLIQGLPACWTSYSTSGESWLVNTGAAYAAAGAGDHTGNGGNYAWVDASVFNGVTSNDVTLESPLIDASAINVPELEFWMFSVNTNLPGNYNTLTVDVYDGANWNTVFTHQTDNGGWTKYIVDLSNLTITGNMQLRFIIDESAPASPWFNDILIDDVTLREQPTCPVSSSISATNVQTDALDLSWMANSSATLWNIEYGPKDFTLGSGTMLSGITNMTATIAGLISGTCYDFYLQDDCGGGDLSVWEGPYTFCTAHPAPYTQAFSNDIPDDWSTYSTSFEKWQFDDNISTKDGLGHGPAADHTTGSGFFAYVDDSENPASMDAALETPYVDVTGLTAPTLSFFFLSNNEGGNPNATLSVDVWDGSQWNTGAFTTTGNSIGLGWQEVSVPLSSFSISGAVKARFVVNEDNGSFYDDIAIDDVRIGEGYTSDIKLAHIDFPSEYLKIPYYQSGFNLQPTVVIQNLGSQNESAVNVDFEILSPSGASVFTETVNVGLVMQGEVKEVSTSGLYTPMDLGQYTINATIAMATPDENPANDMQSSSDLFEITGSTFARDLGTTERELGYAPGANGYIGNIFTMNDDAYITSVDITLIQGDSSLAGEQLFLDVLGVVNGVPDASIVYGSATAITLTDIGNGNEQVFTMTFDPPLFLAATDVCFAVLDAPDNDFFVGLSDEIFTPEKSVISDDFFTWSSAEDGDNAGSFAIQPKFDPCGVTPFSISGSTSGTSTSGGSDGSITIATSGGIAPFTYTWSNGATTQDLTNIPEGVYDVTITDALGCSQTEAWSIFLTNTIEMENLNAIAIYPNPVSTTATLDVEFSKTTDIRIDVVNVLGQTVRTIIEDNFLEGQINIDVQDLAAGTYLIQLQANNQIHTEKITVVD